MLTIRKMRFGFTQTSLVELRFESESFGSFTLCVTASHPWGGEFKRVATRVSFSLNSWRTCIMVVQGENLRGESMLYFSED